MKPLKHIILSVVALFVATDISFAQTYSISPNDTFEVVGTMEDLQTLTISQVNNTTDTLYFKWEKISESVPSNWEASVCDNFVCYTVLMDSGATNPVYPTESGFILLHVTPHVTYGTAIIRYAIWDIENPTRRDTLTFITTVNEPSGISETEHKNIFSVFPNPASNSVTIISEQPSGFEFCIADASGRRISSGISNTEAAVVSIENFPNGIFLISISESNKSLSTKKLIIQH